MFAKLNIEPFVRNASFRLEAPLFTGSLVPGDMRVLVVQSDMGVPATELTNQP